MDVSEWIARGRTLTGTDPKKKETLELAPLVLPTEAEVVSTAAAITERIVDLPTQREALARATALEERLQIKYGPLDPKLLTALMAAARSGRSYTVRSGGYDYIFYLYRKASRLTVKKVKVPVVDGIGKLAATLTAEYTCPTCNVTFERTGRQRYCSNACKVTRRVRKRNSTLWSSTDLSPEARARQAVAADAGEQHAAQREQRARQRQRKMQRE